MSEQEQPRFSSALAWAVALGSDSDGMTDLDAAIRARVAEISAENDDDCNMQRGVSCASQGYSDIARGLLAVVDAHPLGNDHECVKDAIGSSVQEWYFDEPCPTLLAVAEALGIKPEPA